MMDKKNANGFPSQTGEGGGQRKQLPYSVETPYGFHLDLDFLKYVDDIEKGNTIKRVHIHRRVRGPKFSTLPRNFSLPGHGPRPAPKEKDTIWSGTSTLGPKPKSRVTEVQQIFDFRPSDGGTTSQSSRGTSSQVTTYASTKPREEAVMGVRVQEPHLLGLQSRPNLLRASSMPVTAQHRKGSDTGSPDRVLGTPENGSSENVFRASPDIIERRSVPPERVGLHQQITVALKRVRELEEQVRTIPELKAQISFLREEREKLLLQLQAQAKASVSSSSPVLSTEVGTYTQPQEARASGSLSVEQPICKETQSVAEISVSHGERETHESAQERDRQTQPLELGSRLEQLSQDITVQESATHKVADACNKDLANVHHLQEKLTLLEANLTKASQDLERTNSLLSNQIEENKLKEVKILQLSEGVRVEVCTTERDSRVRRASVDRGTETEKVDITNQETLTESTNRIDQGTDTERICIKVCVSSESVVSVDQGAEAVSTDSHGDVPEIEAAVGPVRSRANSVDRSTETERVDTQDQVTETPAAERVDQVTETEGEVATDHPMRPRARSVDRGTETDRVDTVDRVTETEAALRTDQQTETDRDRRPDNNPVRNVEAESQVAESEGSQSILNSNIVLSEAVRDENAIERDDKENVASETVTVAEVDEDSVRGENVNERDAKDKVTSITVAVAEADTVAVAEVDTERSVSDENADEKDDKNEVAKDTVAMADVDKEPSVAVTESVANQSLGPDVESKDEGDDSQIMAAARESGDKESRVLCFVTEIVETVKVASENEEKQPTVEIVETVQVSSENAEKQTTVEIVETVPVASDNAEKQPTVEIVETVQVTSVNAEKQTPVVDNEAMSIVTKETLVTEAVVVVSETSVMKTVAPVRPQRGRRPTPEQPQSQSQPQPSPPQLQAPPQRPRRGSSETQRQLPEPQKPTHTQAQEQAPSQLQAEAPPRPRRGSSETQIQQSEPQTSPHAPPQSPPVEVGIIQTPSESQIHAQDVPQHPCSGSSESQTQPQPDQSQPQPSDPQTDSKEVQPPRRGSGDSKSSRRGSAGIKAHTVRRASSEAQPPSQGPARGSGETQSLRKGSGESHPARRGSSESQTPRRDSGESQPVRRGSGDGAQRGGSSEAQASRRESIGSSESPTSPAALGQVVTRLTGLLGEQWAQLGSGSGAQQGSSQQESLGTQKQTVGKGVSAGKGTSAKPAGKSAAAGGGAAAGKPAGKPGPSKMSSIQSQLVSSLSVLSAFYSPGQKSASASKQQEQGLKSIMKKNGIDKQGNRGAKKNLKFVGVNGGYETTSSEESSGDEKSRQAEEAEEEEEDSSEPEVEQEKEAEAAEEPKEAAVSQEETAQALAQGEAAVSGEKEAEGGPQAPEGSLDFQGEEEGATGEQVNQNFIDACVYVKDRMEEVSSPDKEMRQVLLVLYQEWFKVSSQKDSLADTVTLYLRQVGLTTPTLLPYVVNLTDGNGNTALHYSVSHSNFPVVKLLLDTGLCETDNVNKAGYTAVMLAALTAAESPDDLEVVLQLLKRGEVNARSSQASQTGLMLAVSHGRVAMVKLLLSCGADVNAQDRDGSTALMCSCEHGHTNITSLLLETGRCDTGLTDKDGQTALAVATAASHQDIVDLLKAHEEARASGPASASAPALD